MRAMVSASTSVTRSFCLTGVVARLGGCRATIQRTRLSRGTMRIVRDQELSDAALQELLGARLTYSEVGRTQGELPGGYHHLERGAFAGAGRELRCPFAAGDGLGDAPAVWTRRQRISLARRRGCRRRAASGCRRTRCPGAGPGCHCCRRAAPQGLRLRHAPGAPGIRRRTLPGRLARRRQGLAHDQGVLPFFHPVGPPRRADHTAGAGLDDESLPPLGPMSLMRCLSPTKRGIPRFGCARVAAGVERGMSA